MKQVITGSDLQPGNGLGQGHTADRRQIWDLKPTPVSRGQLPDLYTLLSQCPSHSRVWGRQKAGPFYLAASSVGNSWRLTASSSVRNTGLTWTFGGKAAPTITKQYGQGSAVGQGDKRTGATLGRTHPDYMPPQRAVPHPLLSPEQESQNSSLVLCPVGKEPSWKLYSSLWIKETLGKENLVVLNTATKTE